MILAILKIIKDGDPTLRRVSRPVTEITPHIIRLLDDMTQTLHKAEGAGLAAVQVGVLRRVVLVEAEPGDLIELINPEIIEQSAERQEDLEGCLSVPDVWGLTDRPETVTVRAMNRKGETFTVTGSGLKARALCHELDHLDGKLFTDCATKILTPDELEKFLTNKKKG